MPGDYGPMTQVFHHSCSLLLCALNPHFSFVHILCVSATSLLQLSNPPDMHSDNSSTTELSEADYFTALQAATMTLAQGHGSSGKLCSPALTGSAEQ